MLVLAGCAGAHVSHLAAAPPAVASPAPSVVLVAVDSAASGKAPDAEAARHLAAELRRDLLHRLGKAGIAALPYGAVPPPQGALLLHVTLTRVEPGSAAERLVLGFGAGRARLDARAELRPVAGNTAMPVARFDTASDTGVRPGLILPGGIALATGNALHLAIGGGVDLALNLRGGLDRTSASTALVIVGQVKRAYQAAGWPISAHA